MYPDHSLDTAVLHHQEEYQPEITSPVSDRQKVKSLNWNSKSDLHKQTEKSYHKIRYTSPFIIIEGETFYLNSNLWVQRSPFRTTIQ